MRRSIGCTVFLLAAGCGGNGTSAVVVPAVLTATAGSTAQVATVGSATPIAPSVTVSDAAARPVPGVVVTFTVTSGGGSVATSSTPTNAAGVATAGTWTLGTVAGPNGLSASVVGLAPVAFSATGTAGPVSSVTVTPASLVLMPGASRQLTVTAVDQYSNVVSTPTLAYATSEPSVATVTTLGLVTAVSSGTATVTVTSGTASKALNVTVGGRPVGQTVTSIPGIPGRPFGIRVSSGGTTAVTQQDLNTITLVDASGSGTRSTVAVGADPGDVVFNAAGTTAFVSGFNDGSIKSVNVSEGSVAGTLTIGSNAYRMALGPDAARLYVTTTGGSVIVVNPATMTQAGSVVLSGSLQGISLDATGQTLYVTSTNGTISRLTAATLIVATSTSVGGRPADAAFAADANELFVANEFGWVDVLDGTTLATKGQILLVNTSAFGLALTPDGTQVYVSSAGTGEVIVIDRASRAILRRILVGGVPRRIAFTPDGLSALIANEDGRVDVIK